MRIAVSTELEELTPDLDDLEVTWFTSNEGPPSGAFDAIVCALTVPITGDVVDRVEGLRIVANVAVGYDNIAVDEIRSRSIEVTNTPGVLTAATADLAMGLVIAASRRFREGLELVKDGAWEGWHPTQLLGLELDGATIGIVGAGKIGQAVGRRARAFGMRVVYTARNPKPEFEADGARKVDLEELLRSSHVASLHTPLTSETRGLIGAHELELMKDDAVLVNTARGGIIDEEALVQVLEQGRLLGVGLDVFDGEPSVDERLIAHPRVVTLPHLGSATITTRRRMVEVALENVRAVLNGKAPPNPVPR